MGTKIETIKESWLLGRQTPVIYYAWLVLSDNTESSEIDVSVKLCCWDNHLVYYSPFDSNNVMQNSQDFCKKLLKVE